MAWFLCLLLVCQIASLGFAPFAYFRYLLPAAPGLFLWLALILHDTVREVWIRRALVTVLCCTNAIAVATGFVFPGSRGLDAPYPRFARSLLLDYTDRLEVVVDYFREEGDADQSVYVADPGFPLIFHTGMKVVDSRFHPIDPRALPDWICAESPSAADPPPRLSLPPALERRYERIVLTVPETRWGASRPDPEAFVMRTADETAEWIVYRKVE